MRSAARGALRCPPRAQPQVASTDDPRGFAVQLLLSIAQLYHDHARATSDEELLANAFDCVHKVRPAIAAAGAWSVRVRMRGCCTVQAREVASSAHLPDIFAKVGRRSAPRRPG